MDSSNASGLDTMVPELLGGKDDDSEQSQTRSSINETSSSSWEMPSYPWSALPTFESQKRQRDS